MVIGFSSYTYTYGDTAHKHAMTALGTGESYTYDANGNMTCRVENGITYKQDYNAENQLSSVYKMNGSCTSGTVLETTSFIYDGDGNMVKRIKPDGSKTLYVGGIYEVDKSSGGTVTQTRTYYPAAGAMRIGSTLYYVLKDHLGSASVVTDATANAVIVGEDRFYPFGRTRLSTGTMYTDRLFTGQREITDLGIYYYGARFYSPYINRFLSADTIVPGYANPQNLNRYSYVLNNPLRYTDPTGHMIVEDEGSTKGGLNCSKYPQYCNNGKKKSDEELQAMSPKPKPNKRQQEDNPLTYSFDNHLLLDSWEGSVELDPADFDELLSDVRNDVHQKSKGWLLVAASNYDTPFYDRSGPFGIGKLSGTGCINGKCYARSELNYIGEGELWAAVRVSKPVGHLIVWEWKQSKNLFNPMSIVPVSEGTIEMFDTGYDNYNQLYPPTP